MVTDAASPQSRTSMEINTYFRINIFSEVEYEICTWVQRLSITVTGLQVAAIYNRLDQFNSRPI